MDRIYEVSGMDCANCAKSIEVGVAKLDGVTACTLAYHTAKLRVSGDVQPDMVLAQVQKLGYQAVLEDRTHPTPAVNSQTQQVGGVLGFVKFLLARRDTALALLGLGLILPGVLFDELLPVFGIEVHSPVFAAMSVGALAAAGWPIVRGAWRQLVVNHAISINLLMTIAAVGALIIGAYTEAGLVMVLFAIGEALEGYTAAQGRNAIQALMAVAPNDAIV
ncbi:MAG: cation transporter, partial [Anaerolineae bacterium]|nr:cation transporter [Anaerolineae bacterium]